MTAHANGTAAADPMSTQFGEPESYECKLVTACFVRKMFYVKLFREIFGIVGSNGQLWSML
mgnify:CR=1 FL=1